MNVSTYQTNSRTHREDVPVYAIIDENRVRIDAASKRRNAYKEQEDSGAYVYLGYGNYYYPNGNPALSDEAAHFWKFKN